MKAPSLTWLGACIVLISALSGQAWATSPLEEIQLDSPVLTRRQPPPPPPPALSVSILVNAAANRHPISPEIYGVAFATAAQLMDLNVSLNRNGGNATSRYNWLL